VPYPLLVRGLRLALISALVISLAVFTRPAHAIAAAPDAIPAPLVAPVVISGRYSGPKLWRVSKNGHALWILGTVAPLPKRMVWQTADIQGLLRQTQEVIPAWPSVGIGFHPFTAVHLYALWREAQTNPDRLPLKAVVPPALYARFSALKLRFVPNDRRIEQLRPILAARRLYDDALAASDLTSRNDIQRTVLDLAREEHVAVHKDRLLVKDPVEVMRDLTQIPRSAEIACLQSVVTRLETDLGPMQARARAWALGDVAVLRRLPGGGIRIDAGAGAPGPSPAGLDGGLAASAVGKTHESRTAIDGSSARAGRHARNTQTHGVPGRGSLSRETQLSRARLQAAAMIAIAASPAGHWRTRCKR
jgi:uncharacterized protein YbaP (TraB family)